MDGTVLVADDDRTIRTVLTQALTRAGCKVHATASMATLMRWVDEGKGDLVISDVVMPDGNGIAALPEIAQRRPGLPVIVISAQNTIMTAIQAAEAEAFDYLPKPFDLPDLMRRAGKALTRQAAVGAGSGAAAAGASASPAPGGQEDLPLVGRSPAMQELYRLVARVMNTDLPVLISGESGTGKSLIAGAIHEFSDRAQQPFVTAGPGDLETAGALEQLAQRAGSGTLVIDGPAGLSEEAQARLARLLDTIGANGPRLMATSQTDLAAEVGRGLRRDLYYRLGAVTLDVPPLRERVEDIPLLAQHFLARAEREGLPRRRLSDKAMAELLRYGWPGNVRQLENLLRRLAVTGSDEEIAAAELGTALTGQPAAPGAAGGADSEPLAEAVRRHLQRYFDIHGNDLPPPGLYQRVLKELELPLIEIALDATAGNQAKCADLLGINRNTLRKKITDLDIRVTRRRKLM